MELSLRAQARVRPCLAGVEAFLQPNINPTPVLQAQRRGRRFVLAWMLTPSTVSNQLILYSPLHNGFFLDTWARVGRGDDGRVFSFRPRYVCIGWVYVKLTKTQVRLYNESLRGHKG